MQKSMCGSIAALVLIRCGSCRYRTQMCSIGANCKRTVCFFAHNVNELRTPTYPPMPMHLYKMAGTQPPDATAAPMDSSMEQQIAEAATAVAYPGQACGSSRGSYSLQQQQQQSPQQPLQIHQGQIQHWPPGVEVAAAAAAAQGPMLGAAAGVQVAAAAPGCPIQLVAPLASVQLRGAVPGMHHTYSDPTMPTEESAAGSSANSLTPLSPVSSLRARSWDRGTLPSAGYQGMAQPGVVSSRAHAAAAMSMGPSVPQQLLLQSLGHPQQRMVPHQQQQQQFQLPSVGPYSCPLQQQQQALGGAAAAGGSGLLYTDAGGYMQSGGNMGPGTVVQSADGSCYIVQDMSASTLPSLQGQGAQATAANVAQQMAQLQLQAAMPVQGGSAGVAVSMPGAPAAGAAMYQQVHMAMVSQGPVGPMY